jgi:hypothetical protein
MSNKWVFNYTNLLFKHTSELINDYSVFHNKIFLNIYSNAVYIVKHQYSVIM